MPDETVIQRKRGTRILIGVFVFIIVAAAIAIPVALRYSGNDSDDDNDDTHDSIVNPPQPQSGSPSWDCFPEAEGNRLKVSKSECLSRGCNYDESKDNMACAFKPGQYGLKVTNVINTPSGFTANLEQFGKAPFGGDVMSWAFTFENRGNNVARFTFDTEDNSRYKVPKVMNLETSPGNAPLYDVQITSNNSFAFRVVRRSTNTVIFEAGADLGSLILSNQFLQISNRLPSTNVYGLGEHIHPTLRHNMGTTWPSFSRDQPPSWDAEGNLYGVHPFYTCVEDSNGNTHGVLLLNSNAQEYSFSSQPSLTYRTIGGILDFYVFLGPEPETVIQQYTGVIGRPSMPPYWALGFQLCRYGYDNIDNLKAAVDSTAKYDIPHDVQYVDIDHMDEQKIFTVDDVNFPNLNDYLLSLRSEGMRIIYILDPCMIANETTYEQYNRLNAQNGFIEWENPDTAPADSATETGAMLGYVWPKGKSVFVDFFKPKAADEWKQIIVDYRNTLVYDGIWIDMNEPANFGTNLEKPWNWPVDEKPYWSLICPQSSLDDPPYRTKVAYRWDKDGQKTRLSDKTLCMSAVQGENGQYRHYDVHSLYGWSQSKPTLEAVKEATGERGVVISRSTFPGSGQYAGHWLGDNISQWADLRASIIGIIEFNLFGIPYIGADICGFFEDTKPELCKRWMQLGAFYTFSRNHNTIKTKPQGPGQLGDDVGYASRDILRVRYKLLPYLYYLFYHANTKGSTVIRAMHHEFPRDATALAVDRQFMWGRCLLISPILEMNQTRLDYYLPEGKWYNYFTHEVHDMSKGASQSVAVDQDSLPLLHLRGGCIIVQQDYANNTHFSRQNPLTITAALDTVGRAVGGFYWDDGVSIDAVQNNLYYYAELTVNDQSLQLSIRQQVPTPTSWTDIFFRQATILGVTTTIQQVTLIGTNGSADVSLNFNQTNQVLDIELPQVSIEQDILINWR